MSSTISSKQPSSRASNGNGWEKAASFLLDKGLRSLTAVCPRCGKVGLPMPKWEPGLGTKPLFVVHRADGVAVESCGLSDEDARSLRGSLELSRADLRCLLRGAKPYVLFSGGADSLCTLTYLREVVGDLQSDLTALHIDTTAGFPEVTDYVRDICVQLAVPLEVVRPKRDYFELAKKWGIPSHTARWCCKELKVKPVRDFLATVPGMKVVFDGIRAAESFQRSTYLPVWYHPTFRCISVSPILHWSDEDVEQYIRDADLPVSPASDFGCSAECWCGAYKKRADFEKLLDVHPDIFAKLVEVERAQKGRFTFLYEDGERVKLETLRKRRPRN